MFPKLLNIHILSFSLIVFLTIDLSYERFCDSFHTISNAYGIGNYIYLTQGINTIWRYELTLNKISDHKQTIDDIFGAGKFESVDTAFEFDFNLCVNGCDSIEKARNIALVIGEKKYNSSQSYGYYTYRVSDDNSLKPVSSDYTHEWGFSSGGDFNIEEDFWVKGNNFIYVGSAFDKNNKMLYFVINKINGNLSPSFSLLTRKLDEKGIWNQWEKNNLNKFNGIFSIDGNIYGVDMNNTILSLKMSNKELKIKPISSAKEFFNCYANSSHAKSFINPIAQDFNISEIDEYIDSTEYNVNSGDNSSITTVSILFFDEKLENSTQSPTVKNTKSSVKKHEESDSSVSIWLLMILFHLILALIVLIILIWKLYSMKISRIKPIDEC